MNKLHQFAGALLVLAGLLHFLLLLSVAGDPHKIIFPVYGCLYLVSGLLFFTKLTWAPWLGLLFPLSGVMLGMLLKKMTKPGPLVAFLLILDLVVIGISAVLLLRRGKL
jgi:hypothetical protein